MFRPRSTPAGEHRPVLLDDVLRALAVKLDRAEDPAVLRRYLEPSELIRTDGIVETTAREITASAKTDAEGRELLRLLGMPFRS